jgi:hypothetical protein
MNVTNVAATGARERRRRRRRRKKKMTDKDVLQGSKKMRGLTVTRDQRTSNSWDGPASYIKQEHGGGRGGDQ